jgi:methylenetetrahydrofolate reductase (NADPH)
MIAVVESSAVMDMSSRFMWEEQRTTVRGAGVLGRAVPLIEGARRSRPTYARPMGSGEFEIVCEVEPATRPDLMRVRHQIAVMSRVASSFLIPDNHIGRATVSSIAVAHEVGLMGGDAVACLNARDRNVLGFRRDLLTAAAYGVRQFLFVYGDRPETGRRSDDLTVRSMLDEARRFQQAAGYQTDPLRLAVSARIGPFPVWKREADALDVQVSFSVPELVRWREQIDFDGPVYAGVMAPPSATMARKLSADIPQLAVPAALIEALESNVDAGVDFACEMVSGVRESGAFEGVHLIPVARYREVAARLDPT